MRCESDNISCNCSCITLTVSSIPCLKDPPHSLFDFLDTIITFIHLGQKGTKTNRLVLRPDVIVNAYARLSVCLRGSMVCDKCLSAKKGIYMYVNTFDIYRYVRICFTCLWHRCVFLFPNRVAFLTAFVPFNDYTPATQCCQSTRSILLL